MNILEERKIINIRLLEILNKLEVTSHLKGSWASKNFHYNFSKNITYSDIDLIIESIPEKEKKEIKVSINSALSSLFSNNVKVSIHSKPSLLLMSVSDSQVLAIAEYIAQYNLNRNCSIQIACYLKAKFTLLLLRQTIFETYEQTATRIGTENAREALYVKLGLIEKIDKKTLYQLIQQNGNSTAEIFYKECLNSIPTLSFTNYIIEKMNACISIDSWLKNYLKEKITRSLQ